MKKIFILSSDVVHLACKSLCLLLFLYSNRLYSQQSAFWGNLNKGKYDVGFNVIYKFDQSRVFHPDEPITGKKFQGEQARPIRIFVWYPAKPAAGSKKMHYKDYIFVKPVDKRFASFNKALSDYDLWATLNWTNHSSQSKVTLLSSLTEAYQNAPKLKGKFPVIVHFMGLNDRRNENIPLWEFLASYGYIVVTVPQIGDDDVAMELDGFSHYGREMQIKDMEFAINAISNFPSADLTNIGTIGYSYGSVFALRFAMGNPNVRAVVSFDGNVNKKNGQNILEESFFNEKMNAGWLNIHRGEYENIDFKLFDTLKYSQRYHVVYPHAAHGDFEDFAIACSLLPDQAPEDVLKSRSVKIGKKYYESNCNLSLHFFNYYLKRNRNDLLTFQKLIQKEQQDSLISVYEVKNQQYILDENDISRIVIYYGIAQADSIYKTCANNAKYTVKIDPAMLVRYSRFLKFGGRRIDKSIDLLLFTIKTFPKFNKTYIELANNYIDKGQKPEAINVLNKLLAFENNEDAIKLLKEVKKN